MITKTAALIAVAAVLSVAVVGIDLAGHPAAASAGKDQSRLAADPGFSFSDRWSTAPVAVAATKSDRLRGSDCARQEWPYIAGECLASADGAARSTVRTITIETRLDNGSILTRTPAPQIASR